MISVRTNELATALAAQATLALGPQWLNPAYDRTMKARKAIDETRKARQYVDRTAAVREHVPVYTSVRPGTN